MPTLFIWRSLYFHIYNVLMHTYILLASSGATGYFMEGGETLQIYYYIVLYKQNV